MIQPNFIPRTLRGVGGIRLINHPGIKYPKEILEAPKEKRQQSGRPYTERPEWGIPTTEAAAVLKCTPAAARLSLKKHKVRYRLVHEPGEVPRFFWDSAAVTRLADKRLPIVRCIPAKTCTSAQASTILRVSRSTLYRYVKRNMLHEYQARLMTRIGTRKITYYVKSEVRKLAAAINAIRRHEQQAALLRRKLR